MRVYAEQVVSQKMDDMTELRLALGERQFRRNVDLSECMDSNECIYFIKAQAKEFADDIMSEYDLPSNFETSTEIARGFDKLSSKLLKEISGIVTIGFSFSTLSHHKLYMELPIVVRKGEMQRPSVVVINGNKKVLSQDLFNEIIATHKSVRPKTYKLYSPSPDILRQEVIEKDMFSAVPDTSGWADTIVEFY